MKNPRDLVYLNAVLTSLSRFLGNHPCLEPFVEKARGAGKDLIPLAEALSMGDTIVPLSGYGSPGSNFMTSILEEINNPSDELRYAILPHRMGLNRQDVMPVIKEGLESQSSLHETLAQSVARVDTTASPRVMAENLLDVLKTCASSVPCSSQVLDVSFYDQTRMMAAIAVVLDEVLSSSNNEKEREFLLIGGDFSGIQSYIYEIVSKYAGKNLKGRSFYVRILGDAVVSYLLDSLGLYTANVVYNSGGSFHLLAANTDDVVTKLNQAVAEIEECLFKSHGTSIFVAIDSVAITRDELAGSEVLKDRWGELFSIRDRRKQSKWKNILSTHYTHFFEPQSVLSDKIDALTGIDLASDNYVEFTGNQYISKLNNAQIQLGKALRDSDCMVVVHGEIAEWSEMFSLNPAGLGYHYYFLNDVAARHLPPSIEEMESNVIIKTFNNPVALYGKNISSLEYYGGNEFDGQTFEQMCENDGFERMGVLRMDVDNLGAIFQRGINPKRTSLSRYAALSRSFDLFFSGYINTICREEATNRSFIIYAGGDDLFIVGDWRKVLIIAERIRNDFRTYTCDNKAFSISGGMAMVGAKYPIIAGAQLSDDEEKLAKSHVCGACSKDSISFLGMPMNWFFEFPAVSTLKSQLVELLLTGSLAKSFLSKVMAHAESADFKNHKITNMKTYWMLSYDMTRFGEKNPEARELARKIKQEVCLPSGHLNGHNITSDYHPLELWSMACRWAELEYRTIKSNN